MIPITNINFGKSERNAVIECLTKNKITMGEKTKTFEDKFAKYCGTEYAVMTNNGTSALHLALSAHGLKPDDEVIVPVLTFISTATSVTYCGAKPVFVDVERDTYCIDPDLIEDCITDKTKAILPVHLYGHPANMEAINEIAEKHDLFVLEDAAEAHGAEIKNKKVGSIGDAGIFSFYGNKIITTGEGGMVVTDDKNLYDKMVILRSHGMDQNRKYWHPYIGYNYRPTDLHAALGIAQLSKIDKIIDKKRKIAKWYSDALKSHDMVGLHTERTGYKNVYWMYSPLLYRGKSRDWTIKKLSAYNIETRPFFPCLHQQPIFKTKQKFEIGERLSQSGINLPSGFLMTKNDVRYVVDKIFA